MESYRDKRKPVQKLWSMKALQMSMLVMAVVFNMTNTPYSFGAVSPEEATKLGTALTGIGAEKAGNKEGTIPEYTGVMPTPPPNFKPGSGVYPDPFADEKPLFSINAQNMIRYADKLTEGTTALMKRYPTFRIDIYKTHRTVVFPDSVIKNTAKNALRATTGNNGLSVKGARAGVPFPIPKDGYEVMWNHLMRFQGRAWTSHTVTDLITSDGTVVAAGGGTFWQEFPYYDEDISRFDANYYWKVRWFFDRPVRTTGEVGQIFDPINPYETKRIAYQYLPGQRRVKLAPELKFDTPNPEACGQTTFDEPWGFMGSMERYDMKLIGKKEFYVPYNTYRATFTSPKSDLLGPKHINPDILRWELHRMWVVEGTLKPGKRHIYPKRRFYLDEDSWYLVASDVYDAHGHFFKVIYVPPTPRYDAPVPIANYCLHYNLINFSYVSSLWPGEEAGGYVRLAAPLPERFWSPHTMAGTGVR
jgi:hypothetical protein